MDQEWGRETFCFRLTGRKKGNLFITVLLQWCKSNILLYMFLKELVPDDGKIWVKSGVFFRLRDGSIINPETAKRELQRMKTGSKKMKGLSGILSMEKNSGTTNREGSGDSMFPLFILSASYCTV